MSNTHPDLEELRGLISPDGAEVSRRLYGCKELYALEQERIFGRSWLFLGHESQVEKPGQFFTSYMGEESVIVIRDRAGVVHVLLNTCRHRGLPVCRASKGKAHAFVCPYHGWTYASDGRLTGMPDQNFYYDEFPGDRQGLIEVAQSGSYKGLIFATFDANAPPLVDALGDMAWYLDCNLDRREGGTEVVGGVHKWVVDTNWKMPAENQVGDVLHAPVSHQSAFALMGLLTAGDDPSSGRPDGYEGPDKAGAAEMATYGRNIALSSGHGLTCRIYPDAKPNDWYLPMEDTVKLVPEILEYYRSVQPEAEKRLGPLRSRFKIATATVFPTFSILGSVSTIRVSMPKGPTRSEIWSWVLVDRDAPDIVKQAVAGAYTMTFGPSGILEQDDGENWQGVTIGSTGHQAIRYPYDFSMGLGKDVEDPDLRGRVAGVNSEHTQRQMYLHWQREMMRP